MTEPYPTDSLPFSPLIEATVESMSCIAQPDGSCRLKVRGWLVYFMGGLRCMYAGIPGSPLVEAVRSERRDVADRFEECEEALYSGFEVELPLAELPAPPVPLFIRLEMSNSLSIVALIESPTDITLINGDTGLKSGMLVSDRSRPAEADVLRHSGTLRELQLEAFYASGQNIVFQPAKNAQVSVILPVEEDPESLYICLLALKRLSGVSFEVVLVETESSSPCRRLLNRVRGAQRLRHTAKDRMDARRQGAAFSRADSLLFLDPCIEVLPQSLQAAFDALQSSPDTGAAGGRICSPDGTVIEAGRILWKDGSTSSYGRDCPAESTDVLFRRSVDYCSSSFLMVRRNLFHKLGGFDPAFGSVADADFCIRLQVLGRRTVYEPAAVAVMPYPTPAENELPLREIFEQRNQLLKRHSGYFASRLEHHPKYECLARHAVLPPWRVLLLEDELPENVGDFPLRRTLQVVAAFRRLGAQVTVAPANTNGNPAAQIRRYLPPEVEVLDPAHLHSLDALLAARSGYYNLLWTSSPAVLRLLAAIRGSRASLLQGAALICDTDTPLTEAEDASLIFCRSKGSLADCLKQLPDRSFLLPYTASIGGPSSAPQSRQGILLLGGLSKDNAETQGLDWFLASLEPLLPPELQALPLIAAGKPGKYLKTKPANINLMFAGEQQELDAAFESARICVIPPSRYAATHQVIEAAARGIPVICPTAIAAQLGWVNGLHVITADTA
jgi:hypothetical protein